MVRAWLRPPGSCAGRPALTLPGIVRLTALITKSGDERRCLCTCQPSQKLPDQACVTSRGRMQSSACSSSCSSDVDVAVKDVHLSSDPEGDGASQWSVEEETGKKPEDTGSLCMWHATLVVMDKVLFSVSLVFLLAFNIFLLVSMPYTQGYY